MRPARETALNAESGPVRPIVIAAGGTGGHFYPAEALAAALIERGHWVVLMTDGRTVVPKSAVFDARNQYVLPGAGIAGRGVVRAAKAVFALSAGVVQARGVMASVRPLAVVAFGGYPAVPPVLATRLLRERPPVILHEQNAVLGRANRFLSRHAGVLALSFADTSLVPARVRRVVTGNPVRPGVTALSGTGYDPPPGPKHDGSILGGSIRLLVLGGSLGARVFSDIVPEALAGLSASIKVRLQVTQQCRPEDLQRVQAIYAANGIAADLAPFFPDVADRLSTAHLVISRAGASSVAELAIAGRPSILVPLPGAIDDHQSANAKALANAGAAWVMSQPDFTVAALTGHLDGILADPGTLAQAAIHARQIARPEATGTLADLVEQAVREAALAQAQPAPGGPAGGQSGRQPGGAPGERSARRSNTRSNRQAGQPSDGQPEVRQS